MKRGLVHTGLLALVLLCSAHVGSPDAWYEGPAGLYRVLVHVEAPPVVPGIAVVNVRAAEPGITRVTAFVNRFDATGTPPPPDVAEPVAESPGWYRTRLWVMTAGSNSVTVAVYGSRGAGSVVVPLAAVAASRLGFSPLLGGLLVGLGGVLLAGLLTLVGAAVREGVLPPGVEPDTRRRRRARWAMLRAFLVVTLVFSAWLVWWRVDDRRFARDLFRPLAVTTRIDGTYQPARLVLSITDSTWVHRNDGAWLRARRLDPPSDLTEDHGKLVHLFLIGSGGTAFAHLHPASRDTTSFAAALPPLPPGTYSVFADVVFLTGFTETLTSSITLPAPDSSRYEGRETDLDDSWSAGKAAEGNQATLQDGSTLTWLLPAAPLTAGKEAELRFVLAGEPRPAEPYLGMAGHAAVMRDDGSVFIHLHPLGTISLAAQARLLRRDTLSPGHTMSNSAAPSDTLYFPYAFPREGKYTVWVQLKRGGRVLTGAFAANVQPATEGNQRVLQP